VELQSNRPQTHLRDISSRYYFTFVRDPIDHFLSGWAVKKDRGRANNKRRGGRRNTNTAGDYEKWDEDRMVLKWMDRLLANNHSSDGDGGGGINTLKNNNNTRVLAGKNVKRHMDDMVLEWLNFTRASIQTQTGCARHSFPQTDFLLQHQNDHTHNNGAIIRNELVLGADLKDLTDVWKSILRRPYKKRLDARRNSSGAFFKKTYFPTSRLEWLRNSTIRRLCEFVAVDYFLFDFEPPEQCDDVFRF
jgi:hypothetical protein